MSDTATEQPFNINDVIKSGDDAVHTNKTDKTLNYILNISDIIINVELAPKHSVTFSKQRK
jgi:hypothetical protein